MYGRGNIFNRDANANTNPYSTNTSFVPNTYSGGLNRSTVGQVQLIGSNRQEFKMDEPSSRLVDLVKGWKDNPPSSFLTKEMCLHLTPAEFRIEDYFLIRNKQLNARQEPNLRDAIRKGAFNEELLNIDPGPLPLISRDPPLDLDGERRLVSNDHSNIYNGNSGNNGNSNNYGYGYSSTGNHVGNQGGNSFPANTANNNSASNIFASRPNQNAGSPNIFGNNSSNGNSANTNVFVRNGNGQNQGGSNQYNNTGQTGNMQGGNMQSGNVNNMGGNMQSSTNNALFGNRTGNGTAVINNAPTGNNVFRGNGISNGGSNQLNNSIAPSNSFNRFNNNANITPANNLFNSALGSRTGNNLIPNQQSNGNNPYAPNNSFQQNSLFPPNPTQLVDNLQAFLNENRQFLQMILTGKEEAITSIVPPQPRFDYFQDRYEEQLDYSSRRRSDSPQGVIYVNIEKDKDKESPYREKINRRKEVKMETSQVEPKQVMSRRIQNQIVKQDSFGSMIHSKIKDNNVSRMKNRYTSQLRHSQFQNKVVSTLYYDCQCQLEVMLEIRWIKKESDPLAYLLPDWPVINQTVTMTSYRPNDIHCIQEILKKLKSQHPIVRMDAQLIIESTTEIQGGLAIKGTLLQRAVNLQSPDDYSIFYSQLRNGLLYNFTLSNIYGSVSWQRPVSLENLDFANSKNSFSIGGNIITCDVEALNSKCRVTFYDAPSKIKKAFLEDPERTKEEFAKQLLNMSQDFHLQGIWRDGSNCSWSMDVMQFTSRQENQ